LPLARLIVMVAIIAGIALMMPRIAPGLLAGLASDPEVESFDAETPSPDGTPVVADRGPAVEKSPQPPSFGRRLAIEADPRGHFLTKAVVNGRSIEVMVDTGATVVAINAATARRLGIFLTRRDFTIPISTANGAISAAPVKLAEVKLGGISVRNVDAAVLPGEVLPVNLLGMSFLKRLSKFELSGGRLLLVQ
jgi:aspartyl protease family protein